MSNITVTYRDGRVAQLEQVYIRGSKIRFLILPDMLKNAPMLKSMKNKNQGSGAGRGKAAILKAQGGWNDQFLTRHLKCVHIWRLVFQQFGCFVGKNSNRSGKTRFA